MRILSVTAQKPDSTGSGVFLTELVKGFRKAAHQQAVICGVTHDDVIHLPKDVELYPVYYKSDELPFPVCGMSDEMPYESTRYCDLSEEMTEELFTAFRKQIKKAMEEFKPDVILCHHLYFLTSLIKEAYPQIPVFGQCHGSDLRQFRKNPWQRDFIKAQIRSLNGIFALHEEQKKLICETFGVDKSMVSVIGTGYNSDVFSIQDDVKKMKDPTLCRFIFAGKLSEKKGVMSIIRALSHLPETEKFELALAGGYGNQKEYDEICCLAEVSPCKVTFLGKLTHAQLAKELNSSDVFVLPSFFEGLPLVLIEAMACGLRTVCTDLPGIQPWLSKAIPDSGTVFVTPPVMQNEDEPLPESLPTFEKALASAMLKAKDQPLPTTEHIRAVSWDALCGRLLHYFEK